MQPASFQTTKAKVNVLTPKSITLTSTQLATTSKRTISLRKHESTTDGNPVQKSQGPRVISLAKPLSKDDAQPVKDISNHDQPPKVTITKKSHGNIGPEVKPEQRQAVANRKITAPNTTKAHNPPEQDSTKHITTTRASGSASVKPPQGTAGKRVIKPTETMHSVGDAKASPKRIRLQSSHKTPPTSLVQGGQKSISLRPASQQAGTASGAKPVEDPTMGDKGTLAMGVSDTAKAGNTTNAPEQGQAQSQLGHPSIESIPQHLLADIFKLFEQTTQSPVPTTPAVGGPQAVDHSSSSSSSSSSSNIITRVIDLSKNSPHRELSPGEVNKAHQEFIKDILLRVLSVDAHIHSQRYDPVQGCLTLSFSHADQKSVNKVLDVWELRHKYQEIGPEDFLGFQLHQERGGRDAPREERHHLHSKMQMDSSYETHDNSYDEDYVSPSRLTKRILHPAQTGVAPVQRPVSQEGNQPRSSQKPLKVSSETVVKSLFPSKEEQLTQNPLLYQHYYTMDELSTVVSYLHDKVALFDPLYSYQRHRVAVEAAEIAEHPGQTPPHQPKGEEAYEGSNSLTSIYHPYNHPLLLAPRTVNASRLEELPEAASNTLNYSWYINALSTLPQETQRKLSSHQHFQTKEATHTPLIVSNTVSTSANTRTVHPTPPAKGTKLFIYAISNQAPAARRNVTQTVKSLRMSPHLSKTVELLEQYIVGAECALTPYQHHEQASSTHYRKIPPPTTLLDFLVQNRIISPLTTGTPSYHLYNLLSSSNKATAQYKIAFPDSALPIGPQTVVPFHSYLYDDRFAGYISQSNLPFTTESYIKSVVQHTPDTRQTLSSYPTFHAAFYSLVTSSANDAKRFFSIPFGSVSPPFTRRGKAGDAKHRQASQSGQQYAGYNDPDNYSPGSSHRSYSRNNRRDRNYHQYSASDPYHPDSPQGRGSYDDRYPPNYRRGGRKENHQRDRDYHQNEPTAGRRSDNPRQNAVNDNRRDSSYRTRR